MIKQRVPIYNKLALTIEEAAEYSEIGDNTIRELLKMPDCPFLLKVGTRKLIKRVPFEDYVRSHEIEDPCVYFITDGEYVKIGATSNIKQRLDTLQTGNPRTLEVLKMIPTSEPYKLEASLHKKYRNRQVNNEWYNIKSLL